MFADPTVTGVDRLPMRTTAVPFPDVGTARSGAVDMSPWWRSLDGELGCPPLRTAGRGSRGRSSRSSGGAWGSIQVPGAWTTQRDGAGERFVQPHYTNVVMPFDAEPPEVPRRNPVGVHRRVVSVPRPGRGVEWCCGWVRPSPHSLPMSTGISSGSAPTAACRTSSTSPTRVRPGRRRPIVLLVARLSAATWLEDQDQWWHGGIQRSVTIYSTAPSHLVDVGRSPGPRLQSQPTASARWTWSSPWRVRRLASPGGPSRPPSSVSPDGRRGRRWPHRPLDVPVWDSSSEAAELLCAMFVRPGVVSAASSVPDITPWSHEDPTRYRS